MKLQDTERYLTPRHLYLLGALIAVVISVMEISRGRAYNYEIYAAGTMDLLHGVNPYVGFSLRHIHAAAEPLRYMCPFLYLPQFVALFSFFAWMPWQMGALVWNLFNYTLFFVAVQLLPGLSERQRRVAFLYPLLLVAQNLFSFQYNLTVCNMFLLAFALLERRRHSLAIVLIVFSGITKIYGFIMLAMLLFYPSFWRNVTRTVACVAVMALAPAVFVGWDGLLGLYDSWLRLILEHEGAQQFSTISCLFHSYLGMDIAHYGNLILGVVGLLTTLALLLRFRRLDDLGGRYQVLGILISLPILWGSNTELVTYLIAIAGYILWYMHCEHRTVVDRALLWWNLVVICFVPIDMFCPRAISGVIIYSDAADWGLSLNVIGFLVTWCRMVAYTFVQRPGAVDEVTAEDGQSCPVISK